MPAVVLGRVGRVRLVLFVRRCMFVLVPYMIEDRGQLSFNVSFDLQNKLSSSKMIQKDVPQVKIYIPLQNHQDNLVTIEKHTLEKIFGELLP